MTEWKSFFCDLLTLTLMGCAAMVAVGALYVHMAGAEEPAGGMDSEAASQNEAGEDSYYTIDEEDMALLQAYRDYNADVVGHISIQDSVLDHPIVQTVDDEEYYLHHDLDGNVNSHGVPLLSKDSRMEALGSNIVVYGHNIVKRDRDVFCDIAYYEELEYYQSHPIIKTVSASGTRRWLIFAYFITDNSDRDAFRYSDYTDFHAEKEFDKFLRQIQERNWLETGVEPEYGDSLITLSSCSNELAGSGTNRMVVVGKLLRNGEEYEDIVEHARMADAPLLPEKLR